jgi:predicted nucleic acid-binding protein
MPSSTICVDASLVVRLVESGTYEAPVVVLWREWHETGRSVVAPTLLYYEISDAMRRYVVHGELLPHEATEALQAALGLDITLYGDAGLHRRALELADHHALPAAYDAHYLALAETLGAEFWTADRRLVSAVGPALPWVREVQ